MQRQGLSTAQQAQVLSSAGLLQTTQMLNASLVEEAVLNSKISGEKAEQILTELGLIEAKTGNLVVTKECTIAEVAQALATKGIVGADAEAILSQLGLATANTATTASFAGLTTAIKANTVAMAKWLVTNPVGWCILAVGAIYGLTKAYDALTVSEEEMAEAHEESVQKAKDSISEYEELKQELETIQQTYDDNEQKLKDLYKLRENQTITQAEQDYLEELEGQNEKLRQQIEYKQTLADIEAKEAEDDAVTALNEKTQNDSFTGHSTNGGATVEFDKITDADKIKQNTATINALTDDLTAYEKVIQGISLSQEEVDKYTQQLVGYQEQLNSIEGDSDSANSQRDFYQGKIDELQRLLDGTLTYEEYEKAVSDATSSVQSLVSENDTLLQKVEPLNDAIKSTSGENYELKKTNDEIIANAKDAAIAFNGYTDSLNGTADALSAVGGNGNEIDVSLSGISLQSIERYDAQIKEAQQALENEYKKIQDWGLGNYTHQIKHDTIQSVFGNVDMDKRTIITWSDELKKTYKDALDSWGHDPEVGGIDTVFGGSDRFGEDLNGVGWQVAFTPILPDGTFLGKDTVYDYIESIIADAYANDGKVTEDELKTLDAQGKQMGEVFVNGIFAGVDDGLNYENNGNWAETIGRLMHFSGDYGAVEIAKRNINEIQAQKNELISKVSNLTIDELKNSTSSFTTAQEALNTALSEQNETGRISSETLATLRENFEGISDVVEETTNGIIINTDKLASLNKVERENIEVGLELKEEELIDKFNDVSLQLATYESIMKNTTSTDEGYLETLRNTINATREQKDAISEQIGELNLLQLEYENSISKHNRFIKALSTKDAGSGYDDVTSGLEQVEKEWNAGNVGKDEVRNFVDYMSYNDMSTASINEVKDAYAKAMEMAKMYFTESSEGSRRFLELLEDTEVEGKKLATNTDGIWNIDIDDIEKAAQAIGVSTDFIQDQMMKLKDKGFDVEFEADTDGLIDYSDELEKVAEKIAVLEKQQSFGDKTEATAKKLKELYAYRDSIEISVETQEVEYAIQRIQELQEQIDSTSNTDAKVGMQQQQQNIIDELNKKTGGNYTVETIVGVDTQDATARFELFKQQVEEAGIKSEVVLTPDTSQFDSVKNEIQTNDIVAGVKLKVTDENISTRLSNIIKNAGKKDSGDESESGGIYYKGTVGKAFASGYNGLLKDEKNALRSEYGQPELTVYPNGSYEITNTPTMSDLPKGTVIFNEEQTNRILKGKTHSKGTIGRAFEKGTKATGELNDSGSGKNGGKGSGNDKTKDEFKELFDWIEDRIEHFQNRFDKWIKRAETAVTSGFVEKYYKKAVTQSSNLMKTYDKAYERYIKQANKSGLDKKYKKLVQEGKIDIDTIKNEKLAEQIKDYEQWYNKAVEMSQNFLEEAEKYYNLPLDEAATKVEKFSEAIDLLDATLDNISIDNYEQANANLKKQVEKQKEIWDVQEKAQSKANKNLSSAKKNVNKKSNINKKSGIDSDEKKAIQKIIKENAKAIEEGRYDELKEIDLSMYKANSAGYNAAVKYNEALKAQTKAIQEADLAEQEYIKTSREAEKQKFDNIQEYYEKQVELIQIQEDAIQQEIDLAEARGMTVTSKAYDEQIAKEKDKQAQLQKSKEELTKQLNEIEKGTEEWYEANSALADVNAELTECNITIAEMNHSITELADNFQKKMFKVTSTTRNVMDWLASLMGEYDKFDSKTGAMTKEGLATLGTYVSNYNNSSDDSDKYAKQIAKMEEEYAKYEAIFDPNNPQQYSFVDANNQTRKYNSLEEFKNAIDETYESWRDQISETAKYESQIIDFMRSKYENELGYLKKIIDAKKDELSHEKALQEYKKSIKSSADSIDSLQKQIMALSNDDSVENQMRLQKLNKELEDSKEELAEKENDRRLSELQDSLDGLYSEYEDLIQSELSDIKGLLEKGIGLAENFSTEIGSTLTSYADKYNYNGRFDNVDEGIEKILKPKPDETESKPVENPPENPPKGKGFHKFEAQEKLLDNVTTPPTTVREAMPEKKQEVQVLSVDVTKTEKKATSSTKKSGDDGKIKVGEKVKFKSGQYTASSDGTGNKGKQKLGDDVYIQKIVSGAKRPYLIGTKKGGGNLGWVSKSQLSGFSRGGVIEIANLNKQIRENGDDALVSVKEGERILTPLQNQMFEKFINNGLQDLVDASNILQPLVTIPRLPDVQPNTANATQVVQIDNLSLPNVTNYEEFKGKMYQDMQNNKKFETYIRSVSTDRTMGGSRLSKNSIKF